MYVAYGSGTITVFFRLPVANLFYPTQWLSISLFCAISSPILFIHLRSSSILSVSTSQLVWAICCLLLLSHVHIVSIFCQPNESSTEIFSPITWSVSSFNYPLAVRLWNSSMAWPPSLLCLQQCSSTCICNNEDHYHWYVLSEAAHLQSYLRDLTTPFVRPRNRCGLRTPYTIIALHEGCMSYSPAEISLTERNSRTTQKFPFGVNTTNELKRITTRPENNGALFSWNTSS